MNWVVFDTGEQELYKLLHLQRQQEWQRHALQHNTIKASYFSKCWTAATLHFRIQLETT
jgi:hypothetical protein